MSASLPIREFGRRYAHRFSIYNDLGKDNTNVLCLYLLKNNRFEHLYRVY